MTKKERKKERMEGRKEERKAKIFKNCDVE
jgi:hypothetical protein